MHKYFDKKNSTAYVVIDELDLVNQIKKIRVQKLKSHTEAGIMSYYGTALKEILAEGISVLSTDFSKMGKMAAEMVLNRKTGAIKILNGLQLVSEIVGDGYCPQSAIAGFLSAENLRYFNGA